MFWYNKKIGSINQRRKRSYCKKKRGIIEPQNMSTKELLNTLNRYDSKRNRGKLSEIELEKIAKIQNISKNESNQTINLLKSESSALENNFN